MVSSLLPRSRRCAFFLSTLWVVPLVTADEPEPEPLPFNIP